MTAPVTSPGFVGREAELDRLRGLLEAAESAGEGRLVLVSGDAGIGKSRLVGELREWARARGWLTVVGGCVDLGEVGLAYGPLVEVMRRLRAELGEVAVGNLLDPSAAGREPDVLRPLLDAQPAGADPPAVPGRLLTWMVGFMEHLGATGPALVVFEDVHWADQSTRDLMAYVAQNLPLAPVVLLCTYRIDEVHRRHPLRPLVAELRRHPAVERVEVGGLDRHEVAAMVEGIAKTPPSDVTVDELISRTEGNPFYIEELVASGTGRPLPPALREVVLARVEQLSEPAQALLRRASVLGRDIDEAWLEGLTGLVAEDLAEGLRELLTSRVLVGDASGCRFRHALVHEAVYGELLPGERQRLHEAAARALDASPGLAKGPDHVRLALSAHHWAAAGDVPCTFAASVEAGRAAEGVGAFAEAAGHLERALELWEQVPDAASTAGATRVATMLRAASALDLGGHSARAALVARGALDQLGDGATPEDRAAIVERVGRYWWVSGDQVRSIRAYEEAAELLAGRPPSHAKAQSMAALGQSLMVRSQLERAEPTLRAAIDVARSIGDRAVEGHALCSLGAVVGDLGRIGEGVAALDQALAIAEEEQVFEEVGRVRINLSNLLLGAGRAEESVAVVEAGLDHAERTGLAPTYGRALAGNGGEALVRLGRWDDALAMVARPSTASGTGPGEAAMALTRAAVALGRGHWSAAETAVALALDRTAATADIMCRGQAVVAAAGLAVEQRRADDALRSACEASELAVGADSVRFGMPAFAIALCAAADRAELAAAGGPLAGDELAETRGLADQLLRQARALADKPARMGGTLIPDGAAWLAVVEAEAARAQGHPDPELWATTADHWAALGYPQLMAQARFREAEALLFSRGPRDGAARALSAAVEAADRLGAKPLAERVRTLARQARLTLATTTPDQGGQGGQTGRTGGDRENGDDREIAVLAGLGLTAREAEVLALVAEGYTNREVGERLFISHKTASVHVSNLLRKLDVPSRTAAAVLAHRLGASRRGDDGG